MAAVSIEARNFVEAHGPRKSPPRAILYFIADRVNAQRGWRYYESIPTLVRRSGFSESTVRRAMRQLETEGFLIMELQGTGTPSRYVFTFLGLSPSAFGASAETPVTATGVVKPDAEQSEKFGSQTGRHGSQAGGTACHRDTQTEGTGRNFNGTAASPRAEGRTGRSSLIGDAITLGALGRAAADRAYARTLAGKVRDPAAWRASVARQWLQQFGDAAATVALGRPDLDAPALVEEVDPCESPRSASEGAASPIASSCDDCVNGWVFVDGNTVERCHHLDSRTGVDPT